MLQIEKEIPYTYQYPLLSGSFFLALDTTGFQADVSAISTIGIAIPKDDHTISICQWFNETGMEQRDILLAFFDRIRECTCVITYYGNRFALPFLDKKSDEYGLTNPLTNINSEDYYNILHPLRSFLRLSSCRQSAIESYFHCTRTCTLTGKKIVKQYQNYVKHPDEHTKDKLLFHNQESLQILLSLTSVFTYRDLQNGNIHSCQIKQIDDNEISFSFMLPSVIPKTMDDTKNHIQLKIMGNQGQLILPIDANHCVRHYYPNAKDYYYLPVEDRAIHKSLASFVSKEYKQKATADTCYEKLSVYHSAFQNETTLKQFLIDTIHYLLR